MAGSDVRALSSAVRSWRAFCEYFVHAFQE